MDIVWIGTPNKDQGRNGLRPLAVVIHIMDGTLHGTDTWFLAPASRVSAHYGVGAADTPWSHAMLGASTRLVMEICNRWSIAIDRDHVIGHREIYARKTCPGTWIDLDDYVTRARRLAVD